MTNILIGCSRLGLALGLVWVACLLGGGATKVKSDRLDSSRDNKLESQAEKLAQAYHLNFNWALFVITASKEEAIAQHIPHSLVLAVIAQESDFNPEAKSSAGAVSLMQVIPRWHLEKIKEGESIWNPRVNMRVGAEVLKQCLTQRGTVRDALQQYNGNRSDVSYRYSRKVEKHRKTIEALLWS